MAGRTLTRFRVDPADTKDVLAQHVANNGSWRSAELPSGRDDQS